MTNNVTKHQLTTHSTMLAGAGIVLGSILILFAARGDLWLDEIWSIFFAEAARMPWEILTRFKHDNNHVLNTLYIYVIGKQQTLLFYRGLAIASGIGSLLVLRKIALRWGPVESVIVVLLAGTSYPLILYFSEARGYAPAIFFGLLSFFLLQECQLRFRPSRLVLFWCASILGVLSHLTFVIIFLSLAIYSLHYELRTEMPFARRLLQAGKYLFVPSVFIAFFYLFYAMDMTIGGGPAVDKIMVLAQGGASFVGVPDAVRYLGIPLILLSVLWFLVLLFREGDREWSFYGSVLLFAPALAIILAGSNYFNYRYVIVCVPFYYLVISRLLAKAYRAEDKAYHYLTFIVLGLYLIGQALRLVPFYEYGRGSYRPVISEIATASSSTTITVGSDHDFRNKMLIAFYSRFLDDGKKLRYVDHQFWASEPPEWIILHSLNETDVPVPWISMTNGWTYRLTKTERFSGNSGFSLFLYHASSR
ncbi:MAG: hypothetical protein ABSE54_05160 [Smithella sp.]|jgi:hypothetical protein